VVNKCENQILAEIKLFFENDEQMMNTWITNPMPALKGRSVAHVIQSDEGRSEVRAILDIMRSGDFC
jgi:uncharacterized protein (DUF2384 family)